MKLVVAIASAGRREVLSQLLLAIDEQSRRPDLLVVCPAKPADLDEDVFRRLPYPASKVVPERAGLPIQRNAILRSLSDDDIVVFLDDDFLMAPNYLKTMEATFAAAPDAVMVTGHVVADGIKDRGFTIEEARAILEADKPPEQEELGTVYNCYGCNMALRLNVARQHQLEFDENLPLYGWQEDVDFSRQMARYGRILKTNQCRGVHLAVKNGRTPGRRLGYSQIANPIYLHRKGTLNTRKVAVQMGKNFLANIAGVFLPSPWADHKGRLVGNFLAISDVVTGRLDPARIVKL